jgi:hypothetical protein
MAITVNQTVNKVVVDGDDTKIISVAEQGPVGVGVGIDETTIDFNSQNDAELKGFELAQDNTVIHKRSGLIVFVDENEAKDHVDFVGNPTAPAAPYRWRYNLAEHCFEAGLENGVVLQIGQESNLWVQNNDSSDIVNGDLVYIIDANAKTPRVRKASASNYSQSIGMIAMATQDIAQNGSGYVTTSGRVRELNTNGITEGAELFLSTVSGKWTVTPPAYPDHKISIGNCIYAHSNSGEILFSRRVVWRKFGDVNGGNYTAFDDNGKLLRYGNARTELDEVSSAIALKVQGTGITTNLVEQTQDFLVNADLNDYLISSTQLNHDRDLTAIIDPHIHFWQTSANIPNFLLQYRWQKNNETEVSTWTNLVCRTPKWTYTSGKLHQMLFSVSGITPPTGTKMSDIVQFRVIRDNANTSTLFPSADPVAATVQVMSFDVHKICDKLGG